MWQPSLTAHSISLREDSSLHCSISSMERMAQPFSRYASDTSRQVLQHLDKQIPFQLITGLFDANKKELGHTWPD